MILGIQGYGFKAKPQMHQKVIQTTKNRLKLKINSNILIGISFTFIENFDVNAPFK